MSKGNGRLEGGELDHVPDRVDAPVIRDAFHEHVPDAHLQNLKWGHSEGQRQDHTTFFEKGVLRRPRSGLLPADHRNSLDHRERHYEIREWLASAVRAEDARGRRAVWKPHHDGRARGIRQHVEDRREDRMPEAGPRLVRLEPDRHRQSRREDERTRAHDRRAQILRDEWDPTVEHVTARNCTRHRQARASQGIPTSPQDSCRAESASTSGFPSETKSRGTRLAQALVRQRESRRPPSPYCLQGTSRPRSHSPRHIGSSLRQRPTGHRPKCGRA